MAPAPKPVWREVMDMREAADYLGLSSDSLYRYASQGTVPAFRFGNRWRFKKDLLDRWMDEQSGMPQPAASSPSTRSRKPPTSAR